MSAAACLLLPAAACCWCCCWWLLLLLWCCCNLKQPPKQEPWKKMILATFSSCYCWLLAICISTLKGRMSYSLARSPLRLPGSADIEQTYKYVTIKNNLTKCPESRNHVIIKGNLNSKFPNYKRIAIINLHTIISTIHNHIIMSTSSSNN